MKCTLTPALAAYALGEPIRPIGFLPNGRAVFPIAGGAEDDPPKQDDPPKDEYKPPATQADLDRIVQERLGRERAKYGNLTPEELSELRQKAERQDALEEELSSEKDKAVKEARTTALGEADAKYQPMLVETAFRSLLGDRNARLDETDRKSDDDIADFIADLNLSRFLTDAGAVDTAKVLARVEQFAPGKTLEQRRGPQIPRTTSTTPGESSVKSGRELYEERRGKKTA